MITQTLVNPAKMCNLVVSFTTRLREDPIHAESRDYGFDYDEAELAAELRAPLAESIARMGIAAVSAMEVESSNLYLF